METFQKIMTDTRFVTSMRSENPRALRGAPAKSCTAALSLDTVSLQVLTGQIERMTGRMMTGRMTMSRVALWWMVGFALIWSALLLTTMPAAAAHEVYVPMVSTSEVQGAGQEPVQCELNDHELAVAQLMEADSGQQRANPVCDPTLSQVARARARDMAMRDYFSHTNPDGKGPNQLVREAGYTLPDWYGSAPDSNNIESISAGRPTADAVWQAWLNSSSHRMHVLGTDPFYAEQDAYGIGYYYNPDSVYQHYWVLLSAPIEE